MIRERDHLGIIIVTSFLPLASCYASIVIMSQFHASASWKFGSSCAALAFGFQASWITEKWHQLSRAAYRLSDEAVSGVNDGNTTVLAGEVFTRWLPPRCLYVVVIAAVGQPVAMYRGWRLFLARWPAGIEHGTSAKLPRFSCRRYR